MHRSVRFPIFERRLHFIATSLIASFLFCSFYFTATPALTLAQHRISSGLTTYKPLAGAIILTMLLVGLQRLVQRFFPLYGKAYLFSYCPSFSIAIALTAFVPQAKTANLIAAGLFLLIWAIATLIGKSEAAARMTEKSSGTPRYHLLIFLVMALVTGLFMHPGEIISYEVRTSRYITENDYEKALQVGEKSLATSSRLTALRAFSMGQLPGGLGERLFSIPLPEDATADVLLLTNADSCFSLFRPDTLYTHLGYAPNPGLSTTDFLERCARKNPQGLAKDYYLCALLLNKEVERFARDLPRYYVISDSTLLPHYYAEAMVLYNRLHPNISEGYKNPNIAANYIDFKEKERKEHNAIVRRNLLRREYGQTYWWFYFYSGAEK